MKRTMLLAVVLLSSGLQMAAKDRDLIGMRNFRQLSGIPYDTLTPNEKDAVFFMAFRSNLPAQHSAARDLLNNKFKGLNWTNLEKMAKDEGLDAVKEHFATLSMGSRTPTQAGTTVQPQAQVNIPTPPAGSAPVLKPAGQANAPAKGGSVVAQGQPKTENLSPEIETLINEVVSLDRSINGPASVTDQDIQELRSTYLARNMTTEQAEKQLKEEIKKLTDIRAVSENLATNLYIPQLLAIYGKTGNKEDVKAWFNSRKPVVGVKAAVEELRQKIENEQEKLKKEEVQRVVEMPGLD